jgi:MFS family permease
MKLVPDFSALHAVLANRNFALFTAGNAVSLVGSWMQRVAVGWLTWELTHSPTWLGLVTTAEFLPAVLLAPVTGVLADRFDRRRIAIMGQILATAQAVLLAVLTLSGQITPVLILLLQIFAGLVQPFIQTARLVLVPSLVPRENIGQAVAVTSLVFNVTRIIGPALSGLVIAGVGAGYSFALNAVSYLFVIRALMRLQLPAREPSSSQSHDSVMTGLWHDFTAGCRYTFSHPSLWWVIPIISTAALLTWPVGDLMAGIVDHQFARGVGALAAFTSAQGLGAICGGLFLAQRKDSAGMEKIFVRCAVVNGLFIAAFAITEIYALAVVLFALNGLFMVMAGASSQTLLQMNAADDMRGRTLSIWYTATRAGLALGALLLGAAADVFGFTGPVCAAGLVTAGTAIAIYRQRQR